ncbi:MAG: gluconate 2-dehydrogenase subunit 3 family protein [Candidatus Solibacter sp.]
MTVSNTSLRRRTFLGVGLAAAGSTLSCAPVPSGGVWRFFTPIQARTVDAICAQIIPADQDPGAREAGAVHFIDLQLSKRFKRHRAAYLRGIAWVNNASSSRFGKPFAELAGEQQIEILNLTEEKEPAFFELVLAHTRQGFYGDPRHGGNRNRASWKMLGLPYPPVRGREHYKV